jgi:hypothetical protein
MCIFSYSINPRTLLFNHETTIIVKAYDRHNGHADRRQDCKQLHTMPNREVKWTKLFFCSIYLTVLNSFHLLISTDIKISHILLLALTQNLTAMASSVPCADHGVDHFFQRNKSLCYEQITIFIHNTVLLCLYHTRNEKVYKHRVRNVASYSLLVKCLGSYHIKSTLQCDYNEWYDFLKSENSLPNM